MAWNHKELDLGQKLIVDVALICLRVGGVKIKIKKTLKSILHRGVCLAEGDLGSTWVLLRKLEAVAQAKAHLRKRGRERTMGDIKEASRLLSHVGALDVGGKFG